MNGLLLCAAFSGGSRERLSVVERKVTGRIGIDGVENGGGVGKRQERAKMRLMEQRERAVLAQALQDAFCLAQDILRGFELCGVEGGQREKGHRRQCVGGGPFEADVPRETEAAPGQRRIAADEKATAVVGPELPGMGMFTLAFGLREDCFDGVVAQGIWALTAEADEGCMAEGVGLPGRGFRKTCGSGRNLQKLAEPLAGAVGIARVKMDEDEVRIATLFVFRGAEVAKR